MLKFMNPLIEVDEAHNGQRAIDIMSVNRPYDFIFMDVNMPVLDGYQVTLLF